MNWIQKLSQARFLRFGVVGAGGAAVDGSMLFLMTQVIGLSNYGGRAISILAAMTFTWWGNRNLTFREHATNERGFALLREWLRFVLANSVGAVLNYGIFAALVAFAPPPFDNRYFALCAGVGVGMVFNFTLSKKLVFTQSA